jgi:hypothetical protein
VSETVKLRDMTDGRKYEGTIFDNGDLQIDMGTVEVIMSDPERYGNHHTKNPWWGHVIFEDGKFKESIKLQGDVIDNLEADTVEELFQMVNDKHGWD